LLLLPWLQGEGEEKKRKRRKWCEEKIRERYVKKVWRVPRSTWNLTSNSVKNCK